MRYTIIFAVVGVLVVYLPGAFCGASFDITTWESYARVTIAMFMFIGAIAGGIIGFNVDIVKGRS